MRRIISNLIVIIVALALDARAGSVIYTFTYTPTNGPFPSTVFQLDEPGFLGVGNYSIPPFTMSDGSVTYTFTQLSVGTLGGTAFCFDFGTAAASVGDCTALLDPGSAANAFIGSQYSGSTAPSTLGMFVGSAAVAAFPTSSSPAESGDGEILDLDITQTPEPATAPVVGLVLLAGAMLRVRWRAVPRLRGATLRARSR